MQSYIVQYGHKNQATGLYNIKKHNIDEMSSSYSTITRFMGIGFCCHLLLHQNSQNSQNIIFLVCLNYSICSMNTVQVKVFF